ncbi:hypothetical protein [Sphingomonas sp. SUN039]|uniref:hypothetical protein n=1 Tax=Sphingomonas sp. SUN039 TaxID=2937787 RepID=UPI0021645425|nr:hypothetical protein [Sphingomonas sp. SUN039]UVO53068.1 hypothetical protein M0209_02635 [Sphingomonas sp. SUN039]
MSVSQTGHYSQRGHPLIELAFYGKDDGKPVTSPLMVDTGSSFQLLVFEDWVSLLGWPITQQISSATMMDGSDVNGFVTSGYVGWFEQMTQIEVFVCPYASAASKRQRREHVGYIGMGLLRQTEIHLAGSSVRILKSGEA